MQIEQLLLAKLSKNENIYDDLISYVSGHYRREFSYFPQVWKFEIASKDLPKSEMAKTFGSFLIQVLQKLLIKSNKLDDPVQGVLAATICMDVLLYVKDQLQYKQLALEKMQIVLGQQCLELKQIQLGVEHLEMVHENLWTLAGEESAAMAHRRMKRKDKQCNLERLRRICVLPEPVEKNVQMFAKCILDLACHGLAAVLDNYSKQVLPSRWMDVHKNVLLWLEEGRLKDKDAYSNAANRMFRLYWKVAGSVESNGLLFDGLGLRYAALQFAVHVDQYDVGYMLQQVCRSGVHSLKLGKKVASPMEQHEAKVVDFYRKVKLLLDFENRTTIPFGILAVPRKYSIEFCDWMEHYVLLTTRQNDMDESVYLIKYMTCRYFVKKDIEKHTSSTVIASRLIVFYSMLINIAKSWSSKESAEKPIKQVASLIHQVQSGFEKCMQLLQNHIQEDKIASKECTNAITYLHRVIPLLQHHVFPEWSEDIVQLQHHGYQLLRVATQIIQHADLEHFSIRLESFTLSSKVVLDTILHTADVENVVQDAIETFRASHAQPWLEFVATFRGKCNVNWERFQSLTKTIWLASRRLYDKEKQLQSSYDMYCIGFHVHYYIVQHCMQQPNEIKSFNIDLAKRFAGFAACCSALEKLDECIKYSLLASRHCDEEQVQQFVDYAALYCIKQSSSKKSGQPFSFWDTLVISSKRDLVVALTLCYQLFLWQNIMLGRRDIISTSSVQRSQTFVQDFTKEISNNISKYLKTTSLYFASSILECIMERQYIWTKLMCSSKSSPMKDLEHELSTLLSKSDLKYNSIQCGSTFEKLVCTAWKGLVELELTKLAVSPSFTDNCHVTIQKFLEMCAAYRTASIKEKIWDVVISMLLRICLPLVSASNHSVAEQEFLQIIMLCEANTASALSIDEVQKRIALTIVDSYTASMVGLPPRALDMYMSNSTKKEVRALGRLCDDPLDAAAIEELEVVSVVGKHRLQTISKNEMSGYKAMLFEQYKEESIMNSRLRLVRIYIIASRNAEAIEVLRKVISWAHKATKNTIKGCAVLCLEQWNYFSIKLSALLLLCDALIADVDYKRALAYCEEGLKNANEFEVNHFSDRFRLRLSRLHLLQGNIEDCNAVLNEIEGSKKFDEANNAIFQYEVKLEKAKYLNAKDLLEDSLASIEDCVKSFKLYYTSHKLKVYSAASRNVYCKLILLQVELMLKMHHDRTSILKVAEKATKVAQYPVDQSRAFYYFGLVQSICDCVSDGIRNLERALDISTNAQEMKFMETVARSLAVAYLKRSADDHTLSVYMQHFSINVPFSLKLLELPQGLPGSLESMFEASSIHDGPTKSGLTSCAAHLETFEKLGYGQISKMLPAHWIVIGLTIDVTLEKLQLSRLERNQPPVCILIPYTAPIKALLHKMATILKKSKETLSGSYVDKHVWWEARRTLDVNLAKTIQAIEVAVFGVWRCVLHQSPLPHSSVIQLAHDLYAEFGSSVVPSSSNVQLLLLLIAFEKNLSDTELEKGIQYIASQVDDPNPPNIKCWISSIRSTKPPFVAEEADTSIDDLRVSDLKHQLRTLGLPLTGRKADLKHRLLQSSIPKSSPAILLVTDTTLQPIPWEGMDLFTTNNTSIYRLPTLAYLYKHLRNPPTIARSTSLLHIGYIIDPESDLASTTASLQKLMKKLQHHCQWHGITNTHPTLDTISEYSSNSDIYLYCGHGSGERYCTGPNYLSKSVLCKALALLFGCSSVGNPSKNKISLTLSYLLSGCPFLVGTLWDVTDKDIDRLGIHFLEKIIHSENPALSKYLSESKKVCKLQHLTGLATVCYGIPHLSL